MLYLTMAIIVRGIGDKYEVMAANHIQSMKIGVKGYLYVIKKIGYGAHRKQIYFSLFAAYCAAK